MKLEWISLSMCSNKEFLHQEDSITNLPVLIVFVFASSILADNKIEGGRGRVRMEVKMKGQIV